MPLTGIESLDPVDYSVVGNGSVLVTWVTVDRGDRDLPGMSHLTVLASRGALS